MSEQAVSNMEAACFYVRKMERTERRITVTRIIRVKPVGVEAGGGFNADCPR